MAAEKRIVVWSKQGCSYCETVKAFLTEKEIPFSTIDVTANDTFRDVLEVKYDIRYVPVVEIGTGTASYQAVLKPDIEALKEALTLYN
ncbi:glutaredoxin family protein [Terribacillus sp. DMT04]|uniref:glutaredoxin family protein n=1 Tax=Terribacillus sp. DMT04 TaxID=2850441 RepID=UPI001C2C28E0|nr:glutaredoxin family protein [Terribacillus sp. DMT04]QXE03259.1 glutaredoxin family protein [Terribacillus sp. DMT04]